MVTYAGSLIVHDADSHLMEGPRFLLEHLEPQYAARIGPLWMRGLGEFAEETMASMDSECLDPATRADIESGLLTRKNWWALGAHDPRERSRALDLLGFRAQLVFSTHSSRSITFRDDRSALSDGPPPPPPVTDPELVWAMVRAHNHAMAAFCNGDRRLLAVGWTLLDDPRRALEAAREAIEVGCAALEVPSAPPPGHSITHKALDPLWTLLETHRVPLVFHLGGGGRIPDPVFGVTGRSYGSDEAGNFDPLRPLRAVGIPAPVELALAALVIDGVLHRHPGLRVGVIEQGATWVPGFLRQLEQAVYLDRLMRGGVSTDFDLPRPPSSYVLDQVRFTPFASEPIGWLVDQSDDSLFMFSSDYPHAEGGTAPLEQFLQSVAGRPKDVIDRLLRGNFEHLMTVVP